MPISDRATGGRLVVSAVRRARVVYTLPRSTLAFLRKAALVAVSAVILVALVLFIVFAIYLATVFLPVAAVVVLIHAVNNHTTKKRRRR
jgi:hypothetical protein